MRLLRHQRAACRLDALAPTIAIYTNNKPTKQVEKPSDITAADKLIFPGVGSFGQAIDILKERDYVKPLQDYVAVRCCGRERAVLPPPPPPPPLCRCPCSLSPTETHLNHTLTQSHKTTNPNSPASPFSASA